MIEEINAVTDAVNTLLVVGHEQTMSALALRLAADEAVDSAAMQHISEKYPTSGIAILRLTGQWRDLQLGRSALTGFHVPR